MQFKFTLHFTHAHAVQVTHQKGEGDTSENNVEINACIAIENAETQKENACSNI